MSKENYDDIDAIPGVLSEGNQDTNFRNIERAVAKATSAIPTAVWGNFPEDEIPKIKATITPTKSIRNPITPVRKARICSVVDEILEEIKKHPIGATLVASALVLGLLVSIPYIKTTSQMNKLTTSYSAQLEDFNYGEKQGMFSKIKLTIEPSDFIKNSNLTPNSHMRLYILSTVIQDSDFYTILKELGYRGFDDYVNKLGFSHTEDFRAGEHYSREYEEKLKDLITEVKKNQDLLPQYLEMYPELGFIYDVRDEDQAMSTTNNGRGH